MSVNAVYIIHLHHSLSLSLTLFVVGEDDQHHAVSTPEATKSTEANPAIKSELDKKTD